MEKEETTRLTIVTMEQSMQSLPPEQVVAEAALLLPAMERAVEMEVLEVSLSISSLPHVRVVP